MSNLIIPRISFSSNTKSVSLALIVSTCTILTASLAPLLLPTVFASSEMKSYTNNAVNTYSNITLLDLYPELKEYLYKKALSQIDSATESSASALVMSQKAYDDKQQYSVNYGRNTWQNAYQYGTNGNGGDTDVGQVHPGSHGHWDGRGGGEYDMDSATESSYNYDKEVLKYWQPFGPPEFYDSWKFKPHSPPSQGWKSAGWFPFLEEETESDELSKHVPCLAGLLGIKTLKSLKFFTIFKKLKIIAIAVIAFKLGVLLSPVAIPLLFPIIISVTVVKILPLILIIVLLLKILKKQVKIKKPFGKFLDSTSSLFFDDVDTLTEKVLNGSEEVKKLTIGISRNENNNSAIGRSSTSNIQHFIAGKNSRVRSNYTKATSPKSSKERNRVSSRNLMDGFTESIS